MKRLLVLALVGALIGVVAASLVVPPLLSWYNEPGNISGGTSAVQTLCNIPELIHYTSRRLLEGQLVGGAIGAVLFAIVGSFVGREK
jgi:uncharacterized membrane protein YfcA